MDIEIDLWSDYIAALRGHLTAKGFQLASTEDDDAVVIGFFNWQKRRIAATPRKTHRSQNFSCPPEFTNAIGEITRAIEAGDDINPYLSKALRKLDYSDLMLNDWGVHHMHLGETVEPSGFVTRTGPLLFVRFTATDAYFINIFRHGAWSNQEIVSTIHENWPDLIEPYRVKGVVDLAFSPTDSDIAELRKAHINTMLKVSDGTIYAPIGLGSASDGTAVDVMLHVTNTRRALRKAEEAVKAEVVQNPKPFGAAQKLKFKLQLDGTKAHAVEENSRVAVRLWG